MILTGLLSAVRSKFLPADSDINVPINPATPSPSIGSSMCSCNRAAPSTSSSGIPAQGEGMKRVASNFAATYYIDEEDEEPEPRRRSSTSAKLSRPERIKRMLHKLENVAEDMLSDNDVRCHVCLISRASVRSYPCGHQVFCRRCGVRLIKALMESQNDTMNCIVCRQEISVLRYQKPTQPVKVPSEKLYTHARSWPKRSNS